jgi:hypothetical protein
VAGANQRLWIDFQLRRDLYKVRFVRFEEPDQGCKQCGFTRPPSQLIRPNSGQVEEPPGPALITERCCKRPKRECLGVVRRVIW